MAANEARNVLQFNIVENHVGLIYLEHFKTNVKPGPEI